MIYLEFIFLIHFFQSIYYCSMSKKKEFPFIVMRYHQTTNSHFLTLYLRHETFIYTIRHENSTDVVRGHFKYQKILYRLIKSLYIPSHLLTFVNSSSVRYCTIIILNELILYTCDYTNWFSSLSADTPKFDWWTV